MKEYKSVKFLFKITGLNLILAHLASHIWVLLQYLFMYHSPIPILPYPIQYRYYHTILYAIQFKEI